jgi:hypothetical protein
MIRKLVEFFVLCLVLRLLAGCTTPMYGGGQYGYAPSYVGGYGSGMFHRPAYAMPAPPSNVGFLYREPVGWEDGNPRSFRLKNTTDNLGSRCWLDGRQVMPTAWGSVPQAPIATQTGVAMAPLMPPQSETYFIVSVGKHHLRCQLYSGPPPYQATHELNLEFQTNSQGGRTFHLHPDFMSAAHGLPAN